MPCSLIGNPSVELLGAIAPTQSGKTVFLQTAVMYAIDQDPGPLLYVLPDENAAKKQIKRIQDIVKESDHFHKYLTGNKKDISQYKITLNNMTIEIGWAGGLATLSSDPRKVVVWDEARLMPLTTGEESNAIKLGMDRLTTYLHFGIGQGFMVSSPSVEGDLLHQQLSVPGTTTLYWHVPCPKCGKYQLLDFFKNLKVSKGKAICECIFCNGSFGDLNHKREWNEYGVYAPKNAKINDDGSLEEPIKKTKRMFFRWSSMESPFRTFQKIWDEFRQTKDKIHDYRNFWQCWLARFWVNDISKTTKQGLNSRKCKLRKGEVPLGTKLVTMGIDTQDDGFYVVARAWTGSETYLIDETFLASPIATATVKDIRDLFKRDVIDRTFTCTETLVKWKAALIGIDTGGHRTKILYEATECFKEVVWCKGAKGVQSTTIKYNKELNLYHVKTDEYLDETENIVDSNISYLPNNISEKYLTHFTNVRKRKFQNKRTGEEKIEWVKIGKYDLRYADLHSFIVLDIPTSKGTFRNELEKPDWSYNPSEYLKKVVRERSIKNRELPDAGNPYNIPDINW